MLSKKLCIALLIAAIGGVAMPALAMDKVQYYKDDQLVTKAEYEQAQIAKKNYDNWLDAECMKDPEYQENERENERKIAQEANPFSLVWSNAKKLRLKELSAKQDNIRKKIASRPNTPQPPCRILHVSYSRKRSQGVDFGSILSNENTRIERSGWYNGLSRQDKRLFRAVLAVSGISAVTVLLGGFIGYAIARYKKHKKTA